MENAAVIFDGITKHYGAATALDKASFEIPKGAIFGLIGPNGSGKSTTLNILTTFLKADGGNARVWGHDVAQEPMAVKARLGYAPEEVQLYNGLTAREFLQLVGALHNMPPDQAEARAESLLDHFGLTARADDPLGAYSKGMRRKALIMAALVHNPDVLVLDEPLEGLDVVAQEMLKQIVREQAAAGKTVIYSTHILEVLDGFCTHVLLLRQGKVLAYGNLDEVHQQLGLERLADAFLQKAQA